MSLGTPDGTRFFKWTLSAHSVCLLIVLSVFICVLKARDTGYLQFLEFHAYDYLIQHQTKAPTTDPIVLVEMTESDIHNGDLDYPIYDNKLADLLRKLQADQPAVIGLDIYRDIAVPKSGIYLQEFNEVLRSYSNIIAIFTLGGEEEPIKAPALLNGNVDRTAFNDNFSIDVGVDRTSPKVRRTVLFSTTDDGKTFYSLPFSLALFYLERKGIQLAPDPADTNVPPHSLLLGKSRLRSFQPNDGAYVDADAGGFQMLLDFKCPTNFTRYTVSEALSGQIPPGSLRDKIILIGMNTPSVSDERVTPINRRHRGIEVQALTINQLLRQAIDGEKPLQFWNAWVDAGWILLWCALGGGIAYWVRSPWHFALSTVACLLGLGGITWIAFNMGWWIPIITPAVAYIPATALVVSYISSLERSMRAILMKLYSRHVSKEIAESIWANRDSFLAGQRPLAQKLVVTVLFTDLKGFSTISETMEPARLYEWLNGYLGAMAQEIQQNGGVLKQFTGDGVLALFGVPIPHTKPAEQAADATAAVRCALAMGRRLVELSVDWQKAGLPAVSMRAGVYTGEVAAGSVGSDDRFEYAVIGDVVNTASRLESYDKSIADPDKIPNRCRILIGAPTHDLLGGSFLTREIGLLEVKGKVNKVPVFQVFDDAVPPLNP